MISVNGKLMTYAEYANHLLGEAIAEEAKRLSDRPGETMPPEWFIERLVETIRNRTIL